MNILQVGDNDLIGNKFNGHDLHFYLNEKGHSASHLVMNKESDDPHTHCFGIYRSQDCFTKNLFYEPLFLQSDLVHFHLVHNLKFDLNYLPVISKLKPIVWTIHDPWVLAGRCVHHFDCEKWKDYCGDCSLLDTPFQDSHDVTALNLMLKRQALQSSQLTFIVASHWMERLLREAPALSNARVHRVPFGIDQSIFHPVDVKGARAELGIGVDDIVLMFRSDKSPFKGLDLILDALKTVKSKKRISLLTVGDKGLLRGLNKQFAIHEFGWLKDDSRLAKLYQACDLFLMPSRQEAFGMMAIEAMSCGKMVLVLPGTSLPDVINAPECGIAVEASSYANELQRLLDQLDEMRRRGDRSLLFARENYSKHVYIDRMLDVYHDAISSHRQDDGATYVLDQLKKYPLKRQEISDESLEGALHKIISPLELKVLQGVRCLKRVPGVSVVWRSLKKAFTH